MYLCLKRAKFGLRYQPLRLYLANMFDLFSDACSHSG